MSTASWFTSAATRTVTIPHPADADASLEIVLRSLDAGDKASLEDALALDLEAAAGAGGATIPLGKLKLLTVEMALVSWSIPEAVTASTIRRLHPDVFEAIFQAVEMGSLEGGDPPTLPNRAARRKGKAPAKSSSRSKPPK